MARREVPDLADRDADVDGIGVQGGDIAHFSSYNLSSPSKQITEANGWTTFTLNSGDMIKIQGVGLVEDVDYFIG